MTTPLEAAVAALLRAWISRPCFATWPPLFQAIETLRAAHASHVAATEGGEYQRGRRDGAAEERAALVAWMLRRADRDNAVADRVVGVPLLVAGLRGRAHALIEAAMLLDNWTPRAAPAPSRGEPR